MRPITLSTLVALAIVCATGAAAQSTVYVSADVPTTPDGVTYLPWQVVAHQAAAFSLALTLPGLPEIDALHKMDSPDNWLFSVDTTGDLAGTLPFIAEPRDLVRLDAGAYSSFFDGSCVSPVVGSGSDIDAVYLFGDGGDLVVGFDIPTTLGPVTVRPNQLARFQRTGLQPCGWTFTSVEVDFTFGTYLPAAATITGAGRSAGRWLLALDIPTDLGPPGPITRTPGQIVSTDGASWTLFEDLQTSGTPGWPISSRVNALSCRSNPGQIDSIAQPITMGKSLPSVSIQCPASCSSGAESYALYEGSLASLQGTTYDHVKKSCLELCPGQISFSPSASSAYYLVVPHNGVEEGSYGLDSAGGQRPQAAGVGDRCMEIQNLISCP